MTKGFINYRKILIVGLGMIGGSYAEKLSALGFEVGAARDDVIRGLKEMGFDTERTVGIYPGSSWTIVDAEDVLGVNLNIKPVR